MFQRGIVIAHDWVSLRVLLADRRSTTRLLLRVLQLLLHVLQQSKFFEATDDRNRALVTGGVDAVRRLTFLQSDLTRRTVDRNVPGGDVDLPRFPPVGFNDQGTVEAGDGSPGEEDHASAVGDLGDGLKTFADPVVDTADRRD